MESIRGSRLAGVRLTLAVVLGVAVASPGLFALDFSGRTDTGYPFEYGDNESVNRAWNTHSLELGILPGLSFDLYGGLRGAFGAVPSAGTVLLSLSDAQNDSQASWIDYDLYAANLRYSSSNYGLALGRLQDQPGARASFDGLSAWPEPPPWLRVEAFGGIPWSDPSLIRAAQSISDALSAGSLEGGANLTATLLDGSLALSGGYLYLAQLSPSAGTIGASSNLITDNVVRASTSWSPAMALSAGASLSLVNFAPVDLSCWAGGLVEAARLSYSLTGDVQFVDAASFGSSLSSFAAILGAADSYLSATLLLSEDLGSFFLPKAGPISSLSLDAGLDHRQPLSGTASETDPGYEQFRIGPSIGLPFGLGLSGYYNYLLPSGDFGTSISAFGGEISEKLGAFKFRLGSSFSANSWESDVSGTSYSDSFAAQQYYLRASWKVTKSFDLQLRASYEYSEQTSITDAFTGSTDLDASGRSNVRAEIRAGYRY